MFKGSVVRTVIGFILAPLTPVLVAFPFFLPPRHPDVPSLFSALFVLGFIGYPILAIIGVPLYLVFARKGWLKFWPVVIAGGLMGTFFPLVFALSFFVGAGIDPGARIESQKFLPLLAIIGIGALTGTICGFSFWLIALAKVAVPKTDSKLL